MKNEYVQYGCGWSVAENWRNFDASPSLYFERIPIIGKFYTKNDSRFPKEAEFGNIVKGLPIENDSCKGVYCSHILEHLTLEDFRMALNNTYEILMNGGCFRLVLPDLEYSMKKYINDSSSEAAITFLQETSLGKEKRNSGIKGFLSEWFGNSHHLWMWDYKSIEAELRAAGFTNIRRAKFLDGRDKKFREVESEDRWKNCLGVECTKN